MQTVTVVKGERPALVGALELPGEEPDGGYIELPCLNEVTNCS
jgi:hypothetical protein